MDDERDQKEFHFDEDETAAGVVFICSNKIHAVTECAGEDQTVKTTIMKELESMEDRLMKLQEVEKQAGVSRATLYRWRHDRGLKMVKVGGCVRIRESDWAAWITAYTATPESDNRQAQ